MAACTAGGSNSSSSAIKLRSITSVQQAQILYACARPCHKLEYLMQRQVLSWEHQQHRKIAHMQGLQGNGS